jgi:3-keto-disaccharide hydrolase
MKEPTMRRWSSQVLAVLFLGLFALIVSDALPAAVSAAGPPSIDQASAAWQTAPEPTPRPPSALPEVGAVVLADPMFAPFGPFACPTGRVRSEPVGEGYIIKVTGRCTPEAPAAGQVLWLTDVLFPDGEVRFDVKVVTGQPRAGVSLGFRYQTHPDRESWDEAYQAVFLPGSGAAALVVGSRVLVQRRDLGTVLSPDDWNTIAVRARGTGFWVLVNDQLVMEASDSTYDRGHLFFGLRRTGELDDPPETAAVFRNLRIARLIEGDADHAPTLQTPS